MYRLRTKVAADAFATLSAWWTLFSLFGVMDFEDMHRHLIPFDSGATPDLVIWGLHLLFMASAALCYQFERPRQTLAVHYEELIKGAGHTAAAAFLANLPLFAWWRGGDLALHVVVHVGLIGIGLIALLLVRRLKRRRSHPAA